jgi:hypothetical protein
MLGWISCALDVLPFLQGEGTAMAWSLYGKVVLFKSQYFAYNPLIHDLDAKERTRPETPLT